MESSFSSSTLFDNDDTDNCPCESVLDISRLLLLLVFIVANDGTDKETTATETSKLVLESASLDRNTSLLIIIVSNAACHLSNSSLLALIRSSNTICSVLANRFSDESLALERYLTDLALPLVLNCLPKRCFPIGIVSKHCVDAGNNKINVFFLQLHAHVDSDNKAHRCH